MEQKKDARRQTDEQSVSAVAAHAGRGANDAGAEVEAWRGRRGVREGEVRLDVCALAGQADTCARAAGQNDVEGAAAAVKGNE